MKHLTILLVLLLAAGMAVSGCTSTTDYRHTGDTDGSGASSPASGESKELEILEHHMEWGDYGTLYIVGTAKNVGKKRLSYGSVEAKFYDADGSLIGNSLDNFNNLEPGETWKFKVTYFGMDAENVATYKLGLGPSW